MTDDPWLSAHDAALYAGLSVRTIREHAEAGRLSGCKTTEGQARSPWRFRRSDVDAWLEAGRVAHPAQTRRRRTRAA